MRFNCPSCRATLETPTGFNGPKVRCSSCMAAVAVPQDDVPEATLLPPTPPPTPPWNDPPRRRGPRRDEEPGPRETNWPMIVGLGLAGVTVLGFVAFIGIAIFLAATSAPPGPKFAGPGRPRPVFDDKKGWGPPDLPPPPVERPDPILRKPPVQADLVAGKFSADLPLGQGAFPDGVNQIIQPFDFIARDGAVYHVEVKGNPRTTLRIDGPAGELARPEDRFRERTQAAFAAKAGKHTVTVTGQSFHPGACTLSIRELADGDALPEELRLPAATATPKLTVARKMGSIYDKRLTAAAFTPDGRAFYAAHADGTLTAWSHPANEMVGTFTAKMSVEEMAADGRGRLYIRAFRSDKRRPPPRPGAPRERAPLLVYPSPDAKSGALGDPVTALADADILRLVPSKDGLWVYALDAARNKLLRVGGDGPKVAAEITLGPDVTSFCLTPDGRKIYACSSSNRIDEIDAAEFKLLRSVRISAGQPTGIAATDSGVCYLAGTLESRGNRYGLVVDIGRTKGEMAEAAGLGIWCHTRHALMMPDQKMVILSGDRRLNLCTVTDRPTVYRTMHREALYDGFNTPARAWPSPDGKTILWDHGHIVTVEP